MCFANQLFLYCVVPENIHTVVYAYHYVYFAGPNIPVVTDYEAILCDVILGKIESERQLTFILNPVFYQLHGYISEDCCICI